MAIGLGMNVLVENEPVAGLCTEHGLSLHLCYGSTSILLDFGQSDAFARNANALGIDLSRVDLAVLSHAHYDHADGMGFFFNRNEHAPLYLSEACDQSCWSTKGGTADAHYIGIGEGLLERYRSRLVPASTTRVTTVAPGVHLVPHTTPGLEALGQRAGMLLRKGNALVPDGFAHEMSLVAELDEGACDLAVFCSCSHAGLPVIAHEVLAAFPSSHIAAFVGGLHLVHATDAEVKQVADAVLEYDIERLYTGHCTGNKAMGLLDECLTGRVYPLRTGEHIRL